MCRGAALLAARADRGRRLRMRCIRDGRAPGGPDALSRELHVVDARGEVWRGYDAVVTVACALPGVRRLERLLRSRPARAVGVPAYRFVAARRGTSVAR